MPVVVQTRSYDEEFYQDIEGGRRKNGQPEVSVTDIWGE
jgi:hypothetical protein